MRSTSLALALSVSVACGGSVDREPLPLADEVATYARATYESSMISTLSVLVALETVHEEGVDNADHPQFRALTSYLAALAEELGLEFEDHGAAVVVALGEADARLGLITHGDVQPADRSKWAVDPFVLDTVSEPGRLVGRGVEDDKGPIAAALYAMKAIRDHELPLARRIELIVSYTEESDWQPFRDFLAENPPPRLNVALDAEYPVVTGEKGWASVKLTLPADAAPPSGSEPWLESFTGGAFLSQIPADARAVVLRAQGEVEAGLREAAEAISEVEFSWHREGDELRVEARGVSAHSSKPWDGRNAITHLAALLGAVEWPESQAARMVRLVNDLVGTGDYAERFGDVAYEHPFMGPLTLSLTLLERLEDGSLQAGINLRRPVGPDNDEMDRRLRTVVAEWQEATGVEGLGIETRVYEPYLVEDAPHVPVLLDVFRRYTGRVDAAPIAIGGGTHARLVPNGVNFGPAMPGQPYTGHSEHEFIEREQLALNLEMYTAILVELAVGRD